MSIGQIDLAIAETSKAIIADPTNANHQTKFGNLAKYYVCNEITNDTATIKQAVQICLNCTNVNSTSFINIWSSLLWLDQNFMQLVIPAQDSYTQGQTLQVPPEKIAASLSDPFLLTGLKYLMVSNILYERFFASLRRYFLSADENSTAKFLPCLCALAEQCNLNEYVYACAPEEKNKITALEKALNMPTPIDASTMTKIALIGCYKELSKLRSAEEISAAADASQNDGFTSLIKTQINDPAEVKKHYGDIPSLSPIQNTISSAVAEQYEENPYPRWRYIDFPDVPAHQRELSKGKNILVAGCATGQEPMNMAIQHPEAQVLGIDLSIPSIAYGKHKAIELGINNIEFMHADILDLDKLEQQFDMIICVGVLHHMEDPIQGWRKLLSCLKPDGVMKIALYSDLARQAIVECRQWIKQRGFEPTPEGISSFRQEIMMLDDTNPLKKIQGAVDFFSTSMCRDLVFHVQEHRFTLPQIKNALNDLDLQLIKMIIHNTTDLETYKSMFPDDREIKNLDDLHEFEQKNPDTFRTMYTFWLHKQGSSNGGEMPEWVFKP